MFQRANQSKEEVVVEDPESETTRRNTNKPLKV